ncbi:MAG: ATP-binding cassette domain-containing protein [candidate division Zixibacteria bacterium]|nr:ATP-binding cassette domain-containing protein [candidate division Zixibacteria bacterium]
MIKIKNVTYRYRDVAEAALRNLSLEISEGESLCIMGSNGSGKSTLARVMAGLLKVTEGRVTIDGVDAADKSQGNKTGLLFQNPDNQMVAVLVEKEVAFALENAACPRREMEERVDAALVMFGIGPLRMRMTSELSGGEKQLVALAAVMVQKPRVLVLDEPDSYLDENGKKILLQQLARLRADNPRLVEICITQYPQTARLYPRLVVLDRGRIVADRTPEIVFADRALTLATGLRYDLEQYQRREVAIPGISSHLVENKKPDRLMFNHLTFGYRREPLLNNVSFTLERGESLGLVGPTGAGKSTLAMLGTGLLKPAQGMVAFYRGQELLSHQVQPGWVSGVFQQPERQFFLSSCEEEIRFGPKNFNLDLNPEETAGFFKLVGLEPEKFAGRDPFSLSVGEKRRLAFAAVLATCAPFIFFDEPTSALDREGVGRFIIMSRELKKLGAGQLIISHDGDIIKALTNRVIYLPGDGSFKIMSTTELFQNEWYSEIISSPAFMDE